MRNVSMYDIHIMFYFIYYSLKHSHLKDELIFSQTQPFKNYCIF